MKVGMKIFVAIFFYTLLFLPIKGFSVAVNDAEAIEKPIKNDISKNENAIKKLLKKTKRWKNKTHDNTGEIGVWTWVSMGLILGSILFPPFAFVAIFTAIIALRKNRNDDNLGDLDRTLAITTLVLGIVVSLVLFILVGLFFWGFFFI